MISLEANCLNDQIIDPNNKGSALIYQLGSNNNAENNVSNK